MTVPTATESEPAAAQGPPSWLVTTTHVVALGWGTCEIALWGGRMRVLAFVFAVLFGTAGVNAYAKARDLLR